MRQAEVNKDECVGCGACAEIAGDVFRMDDDEKAEAYGKVTAANEKEVQDAFDSCPVDAIIFK